MPPWPSGAASTCGSATRGSRRSSPARVETDPSIWRQVLDVNLTGAFLGARAAARVMGEGGRLIFTGSVLGERPRKGLAAYSASKAGLVGLAKGARPRPGPGGHHRERRRPGLVRLAAGRRVEEQPEARRPRSSGTPRSSGGATPPTWPAPTSSSRPTRRRSSPAPSSTSTGGTCSYDRRPRRVIAITGAGGALGAALSAPLRRRARHRSRAERRQRAVARRDRRRPARGRRARSRRCSPTSATSPRSKPSSTRAVERFGRLDVLISNAGVLSPNGRIHNLTTEDWERAFRINVLGAVNGIRAAVPVMRAQQSGSIVLDRVGLRAHRVVARRALLRDEGRGDPARQGRGGRVRPRRDPGQLRVPGHVPLGHPRRPPARRRSTRSRPGIRSASAPPTTWSGPTPTSRATRPAGRPVRRWSSTAATRRPDPPGSRQLGSANSGITSWANASIWAAAGVGPAADEVAAARVAPLRRVLAGRLEVVEGQRAGPGDRCRVTTRFDGEFVDAGVGVGQRVR